MVGRYAIPLQYPFHTRHHLAAINNFPSGFGPDQIMFGLFDYYKNVEWNGTYGPLYQCPDRMGIPCNGKSISTELVSTLSGRSQMAGIYWLCAMAKMITKFRLKIIELTWWNIPKHAAPICKSSMLLSTKFPITTVAYWCQSIY